ncbi:MAG TPA: hypothetical protein PKD00_10560 [Burkholderiales bacterium]|nr:hypothetical protein [Burkholderiales bacterium]
MGQAEKKLRKRVVITTLDNQFTLADVANIYIEESRDEVVFEVNESEDCVDIVIYRFETDEEQAIYANRLRQQRRERFFELHKEFGHELNQLQPLAQ